VDRLIALVGLRVRLELRGMLLRRERLFGLLIAVPFLGLTSLLFSGYAFFGLRALAASSPELLAPVVAGVATAFGLSFALSPLLAGVAFAETHDVTRLVHYPIPLPVLVVSSLAANLVQPVVLAELPVLLAVALALGGLDRLPLTLAGVALTFAFMLAAAQLVGLLFQGVARNRRWHDRALFLGLGAALVVGILPLVFLVGGARSLGALRAFGEAASLLPFAWGVRAAVHAGRGELLPFLGFGAAGVVACLAAAAASSWLIGRIHRGELDLAGPSAASGGAARMRLGGALGALLEKDLRTLWREPALRASLAFGFVGPVILLLLLSQSGGFGLRGPAILFLALVIGLSSFGSNALGFERRGIGLLLSFPVDRSLLLLGKNLAALALRLPGFVTLTVAAFFAPPAMVPAAYVVALGTMLIAAGMDNFVSILFPITLPAPGQNPYAHASGSRGIGAALVSAGFLFGALALAAPFAFLAALPHLLGRPALAAAALPLALLGAAAVYVMLLLGAGNLLARREPELLERVLSEA
jgi:ABC-2 type transport system permease protein